MGVKQAVCHLVLGAVAVLVSVVFGVYYWANGLGGHKTSVLSAPAAGGVPTFNIVVDQAVWDDMYARSNEQVIIDVAVEVGGRRYMGVEAQVHGASSQSKPKKSIRLEWDANDMMLGQLWSGGEVWPYGYCAPRGLTSA